jgi:hypothetical protein
MAGRKSPLYTHIYDVHTCCRTYSELLLRLSRFAPNMAAYGADPKGDVIPIAHLRASASPALRALCRVGLRISRVRHGADERSNLRACPVVDSGECGLKDGITLLPGDDGAIYVAQVARRALRDGSSVSAAASVHRRGHEGVSCERSRLRLRAKGRADGKGPGSQNWPAFGP